MTEPPDRNNVGKPEGANPAYAVFQLAKALTTSEEHADPATRERATQRIAQWETVLQHILAGSVQYGSRTPMPGTPAWATLEVLTGGFATGTLLASGSLQEHEQTLLARLSVNQEDEPRRVLNGWFLTETGLAQLQEWLRSGCYNVNVPEEGALLVVAWLVENGYAEQARGLIEAISAFFPQLRFYPVPVAKPQRFGSRLHVQTIGETLETLRRVKPNARVVAQKEAVEIWLPLYDRIVALFLETVENDWPCRRYPDGWAERAFAVLDEYTALKKNHLPGGKFERANGHSAQLREFLRKCAKTPQTLTGREIGQIRLILQRYVEKRGVPASATCIAARQRQQSDVSAPTYHQIVGAVLPRFAPLAKDEGLDNVAPLQANISAEESAKTNVLAGTAIPLVIQRKIERCLNETVEVLVERGLITSGETLAKVLPQMTSGLRAAGITDPTLRQLYAATYRAFRRRRSLLLLNLEKQVQIEELPWVAAIDRFRTATLSSRELARQTLEELVFVTLTSFPHAILPNKLLQELRALVTSAELNLPLVDELAADIFMGEFSGKFVASAKAAAELLDGSLYARYYDIDYAAIRQLSDSTTPKRGWQKVLTGPDPFAQICASRAGVSYGGWNPAVNGMIIEQQQILTTQNLAALISGLGLTSVFQSHLDEMAKQCFRWICQRQQMKVTDWHAQLIMLKNTAYAWRQMIFFLALLPASEVATFLGWAEAHLAQQTTAFQHRFRPAMQGLALAASGYSLESEAARQQDARRFLGWATKTHWLLVERDES